MLQIKHLCGSGQISTPIHTSQKNHYTTTLPVVFIGTPTLHKALGFLNIKKIRLLLYYFPAGARSAPAGKFFKIYSILLSSLYYNKNKNESSKSNNNNTNNNNNNNNDNNNNNMQTIFHLLKDNADGMMTSLNPLHLRERVNNKETNKQTNKQYLLNWYTGP